jgi:hypothetical protein
MKSVTSVAVEVELSNSNYLNAISFIHYLHIHKHKSPAISSMPKRKYEIDHDELMKKYHNSASKSETKIGCERAKA